MLKNNIYNIDNKFNYKKLNVYLYYYSTLFPFILVLLKVISSIPLLYVDLAVRYF